MVIPLGLIESPINAVTTKFVRASTNKVRCPIFCTSVSCLVTVCVAVDVFV